MAALTDQEYGELRDEAYKPANAKTELKSRPNLPNKSEFRAAFQVFEDFWETNRATVLADVRTALGTPTASTALVRALGIVWLRSKFFRGG